MALRGTLWCPLTCASKIIHSSVRGELYKRVEKEYSVNENRQLAATKLEPVGGDLCSLLCVTLPAPVFCTFWCFDQQSSDSAAQPWRL